MHCDDAFIVMDIRMLVQLDLLLAMVGGGEHL